MEQLKSQLTEFGLDPREWFVIPEDNIGFAVTHAEDSDFKFWGQTKNTPEGPRWTHLQLTSL